MPEVTITYKKTETLKILKGLAKYFDFTIASKKNEKSNFDDILIPADKTQDISVLNEIFAGKNFDAKELREKAWKRIK